MYIYIIIGICVSPENKYGGLTPNTYLQPGPVEMPEVMEGVCNLIGQVRRCHYKKTSRLTNSLWYVNTYTVEGQ